MSSNEPIQLCKEHLRLLAPSSRPLYDGEKLTAGIVHFGLGNFHRAHQAKYLHRLFSQKISTDWAIIGVGILPQVELPLYSALKSQDCLFTLVEQSAQQSSATVVASIVDYLTPGDSQLILSALSQPNIRIVSLTITEGGYYLNATSGRFDSNHNDILSDVRRQLPRTVFGLLVAALHRRRAAQIPPFTVMSCDNIQHNGDITRDAVVGFASLLDSELANWISENVDFPNSMVDRITPVTTDHERERVRNEYGIADDCPVFCEEFTQWVLEDKFRSGRPKWEHVGVQFVTDVSLFETMKIRILNGGHATIAYPAGLMGLDYAHSAMQDPLISSFLDKVETEEIIPAVPPVPNVDLWEYFQVVRERFANPAIQDTVRRLCFDGSNRQPKFIVGTILARLKANKPAKGLALVSALWCRYCLGVMESGEKIAPNDPNWTELQTMAARAKETPIEWLRQEAIYGKLVDAEDFVRDFAKWVDIIYESGTRAALERYLTAGEHVV